MLYDVDLEQNPRTFCRVETSAAMAANRKLSTRQNNEIIDAFNLFDADKDERINADEVSSTINI